MKGVSGAIIEETTTRLEKNVLRGLTLCLNFQFYFKFNRRAMMHICIVWLSKIWVKKWNPIRKKQRTMYARKYSPQYPPRIAWRKVQEISNWGERHLQLFYFSNIVDEFHNSWCSRKCWSSSHYYLKFYCATDETKVENSARTESEIITNKLSCLRPTHFVVFVLIMLEHLVLGEAPPHCDWGKCTV